MPKAYVRVADAWREIIPGSKVKVADAWRDIKAIYVKVGSEWRFAWEAVARDLYVHRTSQIPAMTTTLELNREDFTIIRQKTWQFRLLGIGGTNNRLAASNAATTSLYMLNLRDLSVERTWAALADAAFDIGGTRNEMYYGTRFQMFSFDPDTGEVKRSTTTPTTNPKGLGGIENRLFYVPGSTSTIREYSDGDWTLLRTFTGPPVSGGYTGIGGVNKHLYVTGADWNLYEIHPDTGAILASTDAYDSIYLGSVGGIK